MDPLNIGLWIAQVLLALAFGMAGFMKGFRYEAAHERMAWVRDVPKNLTLFIAAVEILGAIGLILPWLTGILPWLTPLAAAGLAVDMVLAAGFHISRKEPPYANIVLFAIAAFIAYGRFVLTT
jgi:uncharacterized membrane protein YphA (DoxX/SURF4 family)